ncbi:MAG: glutamate 5-kinase [Candidatus Avilachnospira sp.]|jgi:glutamate 5-kinase
MDSLEIEFREKLKGKKRIVLKVGSSTITHRETGDINLYVIEKLVRLISDLMGEGKEVVLVSSGAIAAGRKTLNYNERPDSITVKQALAAVGQARLMMVYQRLFAEYSHPAAQILLTKNVVLNEESLVNVKNTFKELLDLKVVPIVNENDTISTSEISFSENDRLAALVATIIGADLVILLSDIDGLYTDDPSANPEAKFIPFVPRITDELLGMAKRTSKSNVGTGGMRSKIDSARIAGDAGADMIIMNGKDVSKVIDVLDGEEIGTLFAAHKHHEFDLMHFIRHEYD